MNQPERVFVDGLEWKQYDVHHTDADGVEFGFTIWAISMEHAACVVGDIRETATLAGEIVGL